MFRKLAGDLGAEIVATLSTRGEPVQKRLPPFVLSGEQRFTVKPGGERLVDLRHAIQCHNRPDTVQAAPGGRLDC